MLRTKSLILQVKELPAPYEDSRCREDDKTLKFFPTYSYGACNLECFADFTLINCKCKPLGITGDTILYFQLIFWNIYALQDFLRMKTDASC